MAVALVLGGGAPNLTLMAGAVAALDDEGVKFDIVSTTGAGMLIGLLYAAPRGMDRSAALKNTVNMGVHDAIYRFFPVNFKVFHKPGAFAQMYTKFWQIAVENRKAIESPIIDFQHDWLKTLSESPLCAPWALMWNQFLKQLQEPSHKSEKQLPAPDLARLQQSLDLLKAGKVADAWGQLRAFAEDKSGRVDQDSKEAVTRPAPVHQELDQQKKLDDLKKSCMTS